MPWNLRGKDPSRQEIKGRVPKEVCVKLQQEGCEAGGGGERQLSALFRTTQLKHGVQGGKMKTKEVDHKVGGSFAKEFGSYQAGDFLELK